MRVPRNYSLPESQLPNPVLFVQELGPLPGVLVASSARLAEIFPGDGHQLKTWGRAGDQLENDPHWIGVRKGTPLHVDPKYPRYSHQIIIRADGMYLRGIDRVETAIRRGTFVILDTHSPHQLCVRKRAPGMPAPWYVAVSLDTYLSDLSPNESIPRLMEYAKTAVM